MKRLRKAAFVALALLLLAPMLMLIADGWLYVVAGAPMFHDDWLASGRAELAFVLALVAAFPAIAAAGRVK